MLFSHDAEFNTLVEKRLGEALNLYKSGAVSFYPTYLLCSLAEYSLNKNSTDRELITDLFNFMGTLFEELTPSNQVQVLAILAEK